MTIRKSTADFLAQQAHGREWKKGDNWKNTKGGFNPDVFDNLDSDTRKKLSKLGVGPSTHVLSHGQWADGRHSSWKGTSDLLERKNAQSEFNRGSVQDAVWEMGLANIGNKDDLNEFIDRIDTVKAEKGNFLKDGWTPKAIKLMGEQPEPEQIQEVETPPAAVPKDEPIDEPVIDSSKLAEAKERANNFTIGSTFNRDSEEEDFDPTKNNPDTFDRRPEYNDGMTSYDFGNKSVRDSSDSSAKIGLAML